MDVVVRVVGTYLWLIKCGGKLSLTWGWSYYFVFGDIMIMNGGFWYRLHREYEDSSINSSDARSDVTDIM